MAERGEMPNYLEQPVGNPEGRDRLHKLLLDAGRVLLVCGALAVVSTVGHPGGAKLTHAFLGFLLWLAGVSLLALLPVARRFPRAARIGAAVAKQVLNHFFPPWN